MISNTGKVQKIISIIIIAMMAVALFGCQKTSYDEVISGSAEVTAGIEEKDYIPKEDHYNWDDLDSKAFKESKFNVQNGSGGGSSSGKPAGIMDKLLGLFGQGEKAGRSEKKVASSKSAGKAKPSGETKKQKKRVKETRDAEQKAESVTITIECKALIGNSNIDEGTESLIPSNGYILKNGKITIKKGETVYAVLKRAAKEGGFVLNAEQTAFGVYIAGIAGIEEKAAGGESGWKYSVNGKFPGRSCDNIKLSPGEVVVWTYVLTA